MKVGLSTMLDEGSASSWANAAPARSAVAHKAGARAELSLMVEDQSEEERGKEKKVGGRSTK